MSEAESVPVTDLIDFRWQQLISRSDSQLFRRILDHLPAAIYTTDQLGRVTYFNEAAVTLWGRRPKLGEEWSGSWRLYEPDGTPMTLDRSPMAVTLKQERPIRGVEAIAERPDGSRVPFIPYPTPLFDEAGKLVGAVNVLIDITDRKRAEELTHRLAAIVTNSEDAIVSKDLHSIVTSWNAGAERLFGYTAEEMIGRPVTILIPDERFDEEPAILARIAKGERIEPYETVRQRKDGSLIDVSLSVSPIRNSRGDVIGASKIARDITERRRAQKQQQLLLEEMDHRVKNLFSVATGLVHLSASYAASPEELATALSGRLGALAKAQTLLLAPRGQTGIVRATTLHALMQIVLGPFQGAPSQGTEISPRILISGVDTPLGEDAATNLALLLHELATNAAKYGALSTPNGVIDIAAVQDKAHLVIEWTERGAPKAQTAVRRSGFGSILIQAAIREQLGGEVEHLWQAGGLVVRVSLACDRLVRRTA
jgi:PAS domain S-box-containing protein